MHTHDTYTHTTHAHTHTRTHTLAHPLPPLGQGTIGIAYMDVLCHPYGSGLTSFTDTTTWLTFAHEIGAVTYTQTQTTGETNK